jgi:hypothetical protein
MEGVFARRKELKKAFRIWKAFMTQLSSHSPKRPNQILLLVGRYEGFDESCS